MQDNDLEVLALSPQHADRWLAFFDGEAFADNPSWGGCYCRVCIFPGDMTAWDQACEARANREPMAELVRGGGIDGFLACRGERTVGWCHVGPRGRFRGRHSGVRATDPAEDERVAAIVCFLVAPGERGRGVARRLLATACDGLAQRGFAAVEAYPLLELHAEAGIPPEAELFRGPPRLLAATGFVEVGRTPRVAILRKPLHQG